MLHIKFIHMRCRSISIGGLDLEQIEGINVNEQIVDIDIRKSSFSKVSKFFLFAESLGLIELSAVSEGVDAVVSVARQHDMYKEKKSSIVVVDPDTFREQINNLNMTLSSALTTDNDTNVHSTPSGLRAHDVIPSVKVDSRIKVVQVFKLTKDLRKEFGRIDASIVAGQEVYYTGGEVRYYIMLCCYFIGED